MTTITDPKIGSWYKDIENELLFKVVAFEESGDAIEVQYYNGDIGEYDKDSWYTSTFDYIEAPEDWSAPYGELETDDLGYSAPEYRQSEMGDFDLADWLDK